MNENSPFSHTIITAKPRAFLNKFLRPPGNKYEEEIGFWRQTIQDLQDWYNGDLKELYTHKSPTAAQKVHATNLKDAAILTWFELHQKPKYLSDLGLTKNSLDGLRVLDVGAGPIPSGLCFENTDLYCLDPLLDRYLSVGYPLHYYDHTHFIHAYSENIPVADNFFDAVISANAIDHVDNLDQTSKEIERVLKKNGKFAMHVHYHKATPTEPLEIDDELFQHTFNWCDGLKKIKASTEKYGTIANEGEQFILWRNF